MHNFLEELKSENCDVHSAMERCLNDEEFYLKCFKLTVSDIAFEKLGKALAEEDLEKAFEYAHGLKGVTGNMGITPLYNKIVEIVELLRKRKEGIVTLKAMYNEIMLIRKKFSDISDKY